MKHSLVQILVVVANTKEKSLWAEVEKGSTRTAIDRGLIDPKQQINFEKKRNFEYSFK